MKVVVTGGGTVAPIDDVRYLANMSTGRFSAALSEALVRRRAEVWHLHAPHAQRPFLRSAPFDLDASDPAAEHARLDLLRHDWREARDRLHLVPLRRGGVSEYAETLREVLTARPIDLAFLAMAVSDFEPEPFAGKIDSDADSLVIRAQRTPKVIRHVRDWSPHVFLVGFKLLSRAEPDELIRVAERSCRANRADLTIANDLQTLKAGKHTVHLVRPGHPPETIGPRDDLAEAVVDRVLALASGR